MTYHPFPNAERARRQVERHGYETPPLMAARPLSPLEQKLTDAFAPLLAVKAARPAGSALAALAGVSAPPVDEYRLSTRRPIVGGGG